MKPLALALLLAFAALADTAPPQLLSSTPAQGQDGVSPFTQIKLVFSKPMDLDSLNTQNSFTLYDLTNGYHTSYAFTKLSPDGATAVVTFNYLSLSPGVAYRLDLNAAVLKDRSGNLLVPVPPILFNTFLHPDKSGPKIVGTVPADSETGVAINTGIYVVFDKPIADLPYDAGISVTSPSGPVKFTVTVANDRVIQIKTALLLPSNQQIAVSIAGIIDRTGVILPAPIAFSFQTGFLPDTQTQSLRFTPPANTPISLPLHILFSKPVDPPFIAAGSVMLQSYANYVQGDTYPATLALSDDHRSLTVNAAQVPPGNYSVFVTVPFDRTLGKLTAFSFLVTLGASADPTSAQLLAASPPDGTLDVPINAAIRLAFSRPIDLAGAPGALTLGANGAPVDGDLSIDFTGAIVNFKPRAPLQFSTTYTVAASGLSDFAGNPVAPYSGSFTTRASGTYADPFKVLSIDPPAGAIGVSPSSRITITFSHPVDPVSLHGNFAPGITDSNGSVAGYYSVSGAVVSFQPRYPMANGFVSVSIFSVTDLAAAVAPAFRASFLVAGAQTDTTPPFVSSVSPRDGEIVLYSAAHVELAFSKPVTPGSLTATLPGIFQMPANFAAFRDGITTIPLKVIFISNTRVALEFSASPGAIVTLMATAGITDFSGNSLIPFRTTVRTSNKPLNGAAHVIKQYPYNQSVNAPVDSAITTLWSAPLDRASVEQNLLVFSSDGPVAGRFEWTADSRGFAFIPTAPFRDGVTVSVALFAPAHDAAGLPITLNTSFLVGYRNVGSGSGPLAISGSSIPYPFPLNGVIDLQFNQDVPDSFLQTARATFGKSQQQQLNLPFARVRPRVLRFTLPIPLVAETGYTFNFDGGPNLKTNSFFTTGNFSASPNPAVTAAGPVAGDVAQNSGIGILFSEPVSVLGMPGGVKMLANGVEVPTSFTWTTAQSLSVQPFTFLQAATTYAVVLSGFENLAGIPVPDRTWTFRTGSGIDTTPPSLLRIQPSGYNASPDAVVSFSFDKPIAPDTAPLRFALAYGQSTLPISNNAIPATLGFSDDLSTVFLRPRAPLAIGATVSASAGPVQDFAGNTVSTPNSGLSSTFQVGSGVSAPANITGTSPRPDASGVPVNATIQIRSSANLTFFSGVVATLAENGNPLEATLRIDGDGQTINVIPVRPLAASSRIDVTVTGASDAPYYFGFFTASDADLLSPTATIWPSTGLSPVPASVVVRIRFNKPLNPLSVSVTLRAPNNAFIDSMVSLDDADRLVTLTPKFPLADGMHYAVAWSVADLAGNSASAGTDFTVGPPDSAAQLRGIDPPDGAKDVSISPLIQAFFTKPVELTLGGDSFRLLRDGVPIPGRVIVEGSAVTLNLLRSLQPGATYRIELRGAVDAFANAVPETASTFTVTSPGDTITGLRLLSSTPANGAVGVPPDAPIRLTFNKPVTLGSALSITATVGFGYANPFISTRLDGNDVVIQPSVPFTGGPQVFVRGFARDAAGTSASVSLVYTITPVRDTTPPVLEYMFPAADSTIPAFGTNLVLRFSKPVILTPNAIRVIGGPNAVWYIAQDGRTVLSSPTLTPDSDITIAVTSDLTDLAGNSITPVSYLLHTLSADESNLPKVKSVTPPPGAINVPVDSAIQLQFTHAMDLVSVGLGLHATADGIPITGSIAPSPDAHGVEFKPDLQFRKGAVVTVVVRLPAEDVNGQLLDPFSSSFTVIKDAALAEPAAISLSASAAAIDVRFDAPLDLYRPAPYIRSGFERIPSRLELRGRDWLRILPDEPLHSGRLYHLVIDAHTEFPLHWAAALTESPIKSAVYAGAIVRILFDGEINPLSVDQKTFHLTRPDGAPVLYFFELALDRRELVLRPATAEPELILIVDGPESVSGVPLVRQLHRLKLSRDRQGAPPPTPNTSANPDATASAPPDRSNSPN